MHPRVIFALGVLGNLLIILTVMQKRSFKSPTNTFLASLASTDLLLILICTPVKVLDNNISALGTETLSDSQKIILAFVLDRDQIYSWLSLVKHEKEL